MKNIIITILLILFVCTLAFNPSYDPIVRATAQTTNATPTTLYSYALGTGKTMRIEADILGSSGNNRMRGITTATVKNISGTLSVVGASPVDIAAIVQDAALLTASYTITVSGTNVIIQVTGVLATTIDWISNTQVTID